MLPPAETTLRSGTGDAPARGAWQQGARCRVLSRSRARRGGGAVLRPGVARILAHQFSADRWIVALPESCQVLRDLLGAAVGRQQMQYQRKPPLADGRAAGEAEEILQPRAHRGRLAGGVLHVQLAAGRERDLFGREPIERRTLGRLEEQPRQIEILQLDQRAAPFTRAAQGALDVLVGERAHTALRTVLRDRRGASAQLLDARAVEGGVLEEEPGILRRRARL